MDDESTLDRGPFRGRVAHGLLVQSMATGLMTFAFWHLSRAPWLPLAEIQMRDSTGARSAFLGDTIHMLDLVDGAGSQDPGPGPNRAMDAVFGTAVVNQDGERVDGRGMAYRSSLAGVKARTTPVDAVE